MLHCQNSTQSALRLHGAIRGVAQRLLLSENVQRRTPKPKRGLVLFDFHWRATDISFHGEKHLMYEPLAFNSYLWGSYKKPGTYISTLLSKLSVISETFGRLTLFVRNRQLLPSSTSKKSLSYYKTRYLGSA